MGSGLPEDLADKLAVLGGPTAVFAVRGLVFFLALVVSPLLEAVGAAVIVFAVTHGGIAKGIGLGIVLVIAGVGMMLRAVRSRGLRVLVYPEGLVRVRPGRSVA